MPDEAVTGQAATLPSLLETTAVEWEQTNSRLQDIEARLAQNAAELELVMQRNAQVSSYVRRFQTQLDSVAPAEICEGYEALLNTRQQMVALRGRMEQLKSEHRSLGRLAETQRRLLQLAAPRGIPETDARSPTNDESALIRSIEDEESIRESLAASMHAGPASSLGNLILQAELCQRFYEVSPERARTELASLKKGAARTFGSFRRALLEVHPLSLAELGLVPAIRRYVEAFQEENGPVISLTVNGDERRLPRHVEIVAFGAARELLNNARTHSEAGNLQLILDLSADPITIVVEDNGVGFDADAVLSSSSHKRSGLIMLKERAELMGGELTIQSSVANGVRAEFSIPAALQEGVAGQL